MIPRAQKVGVHVYSGSGNSNGNPLPVYTPPLNQPGTEVAVYGWSITATAEKSVTDERPVTNVDLLVPPGFTIGPRDLIDLPAGPLGRFAVDGEVEDFTHGPFGYRPGGVVHLRRFN